MNTKNKEHIDGQIKNKKTVITKLTTFGSSATGTVKSSAVSLSNNSSNCFCNSCCFSCNAVEYTPAPTPAMRTSPATLETKLSIKLDVVMEEEEKAESVTRETISGLGRRRRWGCCVL